MSLSTTSRTADGIPEGMRVDFIKAVLGGCTTLPGWASGEGIEGVAKKVASPKSQIGGMLPGVSYGTTQGLREQYGNLLIVKGQKESTWHRKLFGWVCTRVARGTL